MHYINQHMRKITSYMQKLFNRIFLCSAHRLSWLDPGKLDCAYTYFCNPTRDRPILREEWVLYMPKITAIKALKPNGTACVGPTANETVLLMLLVQDSIFFLLSGSIFEAVT